MAHSRGNRRAVFREASVQLGKTCAEVQKRTFDASLAMHLHWHDTPCADSPLLEDYQQVSHCLEGSPLTLRKSDRTAIRSFAGYGLGDVYGYGGQKFCL